MLYHRIIGFFVHLNSLINLVNSVGSKNASVWFFFSPKTMKQKIQLLSLCNSLFEREIKGRLIVLIAEKTDNTSKHTCKSPKSSQTWVLRSQFIIFSQIPSYFRKRNCDLLIRQRMRKIRGKNDVKFQKLWNLMNLI